MAHKPLFGDLIAAQQGLAEELKTVDVAERYVVNGPGYEKDGVFPHWRGAVDKNGRIFLAICFNMDIGDGWEFADDPDYPEKFSAHALRLGVNYAIYAMTH